MMWAVSGDGWLCVRHASEKVDCVVGTRAIKSYALKHGAFAGVWI
jgi:hypothetical protein